MAASLNSVLVACDLEGHGYSDGQQRVENCENLVQDAVDLCALLFTSEMVAHSDSLVNLKRITLAIPHVFLAGESLGAAIALQASLHLWPAMPKLKGLLLAAPLLAEPPCSPTLLSRGLPYAVKVPHIGDLSVPAMFLPKQDGSQVFTHELDVRDFDADRRGQTPGALGFHHRPINASTAAAFVEMIQSLPEKIAQLEVPFLVFHDPEDGIAPASGSEMLMRLSPSTCKEFVPVPGGLHAPHFNKMDICSPKLQDFMRRALHAADTVHVTRTLTALTGNGAWLASDRWPAENRVCPQLSLGFLLAHTLMVGSPLLLLTPIGTWATWLLAALVLIYASVGSFFLFEGTRFVWRLHRAKQRARSSNDLFVCQMRHLVCVAVCREPDLMILNTLQQLNESSSAARMRVVFAMEEATDRPLERFELYKKHLPNVSEVVYHIHPARDSEVRGLCSSLSYSLGEEVKHMSVKEVERYVLTKVDSQVKLPLNYFPELEWSVQRCHRSPVVWQPVPVGLLNRRQSIGATRALTAMRSFSYPGIFALDLMCVTCYSAKLSQYIQMGLHHPSYLGEDCMMLAQATITTGRRCQVSVLPVVVAMAPPLDVSCLGALREASRQGARWAAQVAEVAEFRWRYRKDGTTASTMGWLFKYWFVRLGVINGIGLFASSLSLAGILAELPELEQTMLFWLDKSMLAVLLGLLLAMPFYEQLLSQFFVGALDTPWSQLPLTIFSAPLAILTNTLVDLVAWYQFLILGKAGIITRQRKKLSLEINEKVTSSDSCEVSKDDTFYC